MTDAIRLASRTLSEALRKDTSLLWELYSRIVVMAIDSGGSPLRSQIGAEAFIELVFDVAPRDYNHSGERQENAWGELKYHPAIAAIAAQFGDLEYGWGWFCNLAMLCYDAGGHRLVSQETARMFMIEVFGFDVAEKFPERWIDVFLQAG